MRRFFLSKAFLALVLLMPWMAILAGITWDLSWEGRPSGGLLASDIDLFFQEFKDEVADRDQVEHIFGVGTDDNGLSRQGSARVFSTTAAPTAIVGPGQYNSGAGVHVVANLDSDEVGASTEDVGAGRMWVDEDGANATIASDDRQLFVWDETTNSFRPVRTETVGGVDGSNLIYNGSFEITDGTGLLASTTVASGWVNLNTATIAYDSVNDTSEGDGFAMETIAAGGTDEGAVQTLAGLKESTSYVVRARARPVGAGDTCDLVVTGGAVTPLSDTSEVATNVFETLEVVVTTTAVPADILVNLESNLIGDECDWDHVTAFEQNAVVPQPGIQAMFTQDAVQDATIDDVFANNPFLTTSITIPGPGYIVLVDGHITIAFGFGGLGYARYRLTRDNCAGGAFSQVGTAGTQSNTNAASNDARADLLSTLPFSFVDTAPVVGGTCRYRVEVRVNASGVVNPIDTAGAFQTGSQLRLLLVPTR